MLHLGIFALPFAGSDHFHGCVTAVALHFCTDGHHFNVGVIRADFLHHHVFALHTDHSHGVARLQRFRLSLRGDVAHVVHVWHTVSLFGRCFHRIRGLGAVE